MKRLQHVADQSQHIIADRRDREPLDRLLQAKLRMAALIERPKQRIVLLSESEVQARAEQRTGGVGTRREIAQPRRQ